jgi:predicted permease
MTLDILVQDLRYAARQLRHNPLFTVTAVLTLAIAIGANTTIFTLAEALLFADPVGVAQPDRLIDIGATRLGGGFSSTSYPNYIDLSQRVTTLQGVYAHPRFPTAMTLQTTAGASAPERVFAMQVSSNYFRLMGAAPAVGRLDLDDDASPVVLSHAFWTRRFGKDATIVGQTLKLNGRTFRVMGVAAEGFHGDGVRSPEMWAPLQPNTSRAGAWLLLGGRLKPGASWQQARAEIESIGQALHQEYPNENRGTGFTAAPLSPTPGETAPVTAFIAFLVGIVLVVMAIACANISGVLLARVTARRREIAVRQAIGAGRGRILFQLLLETVLLFILGIAAGVTAAPLLTATLASQIPELPFPIEVSFAITGRVLITAVAVSLGAAVLSGLAAAIQASTADVVSGLKDEGVAFGRLRLRRVFVVTQVALSVLLVVVAGLFVRALRLVTSTDPGYEPRGVEIASLDLSLAGSPNLSAAAISPQLLERLRRRPDVESATMAAVLPGGFEGIGMGALSAAGGATEGSSPVWNLVTPGYFDTLRMPLLEGRDFTPSDRDGSQLVVIIGEGAARRFWPGQNAVGKYVRQTSYTADAQLVTKTLLVVGVVRDPKVGSLVDQTTGIYGYAPLLQQALPGGPLLLIARGKNGARAGAALQSTVAEVIPALPIVSTQTAEQYAAIGLLPQRVVASVSGSLGLVGALLAAIGVYGVTAYTVARRTREIGIRVALGASRGHVVRLILGQGMWMVAIGALIGLMLAAAVGQVLAAILFGIRPIDPVTLGGSALLFLTMGLAACYIPVRRAVRIEPADTLRQF